MVKYFLLWTKVIKGYISIKNILKIIFEYLFYFLIIYFGFKFSVIVSLVLSLLSITVKLLVRLQGVYKELVQNGSFELILLKPLDPLFGILIYKPNLGDVFILLPILIYIKMKNYKK